MARSNPKKDKKNKKGRGKKGRGKKKNNLITIDFTDVERGGARLPEADYPAEVTAWEMGEGDAGDYIKWSINTRTKSPATNNRRFYYINSLGEKSLWNLAKFLETCGQEVPESTVDIDLDSLVGSALMVTLEDETWEEKIRSRIVDYFPIEDGEAELADDDGEEEEDDDGEEEEDDDDEEEEDDDDDDDGEGEEETLSPDDIKTASSKQLGEWNDEYGLGIKLKGLKTIRRKRNAVLDAMEEKNLLDDE